MDFNLDTTYAYNNDIHKSKIIKYKPNNLATTYTVNTIININLNREYLNQNLFTIDRQIVRENCNLFILFEQRGKVLTPIYQDIFNYVVLSYFDFTSICNKI